RQKAPRRGGTGGGLAVGRRGRGDDAGGCDGAGRIADGRCGHEDSSSSKTSGAVAEKRTTFGFKCESMSLKIQVLNYVGIARPGVGRGSAAQRASGSASRRALAGCCAPSRAA